MSDYKLVPNLRQIVTDALVGMVSSVTQLVPPTDEPLPDFIQAPIDRAVTRIQADIEAHFTAAAPAERGEPAVPMSLESLWVLFVEQAAQILEAEQERLSAEGYLMDSDDCIQTLREAATPAPAVQGEPVAWLYERDESEQSISTFRQLISSGSGWKETPLYAAPKPALDNAGPIELLSKASIELNYLNGALEHFAEECEEPYNGEQTRQLLLKIDAVIAAHRNQGGQP